MVGKETFDFLVLFLLSPSFFSFGEKKKRKKDMEELNTPKMIMSSKQSLFCLIKNK